MPSKQINRKQIKKIVKDDSDSESSNDDSSSSSSECDSDTYETEEDSDYETETEEEPDVSPADVRKELSKIFPSKYINGKVKNDNKKKADVKNIHKSPKMEKKDKKKKHIEEEDDCEGDSDETYSEGDEEESTDNSNKKGNKINIVFDLASIMGAAGEDDDDDDEEYIEDDENENCDSDDEKIFLKEKYQDIELPDVIKKYEEKKKKKSEKKKSKLNKQKNEKENASKKFENEYSDLLDMRKMYVEKLIKHPESISLNKGLRHCRRDMKKLIKQTRNGNAKEYNNLVKSQKPSLSSENEYFKTKLSNVEQMKIMSDLSEINKHLQVNKPYRIQLLETDIPIKYKANVMQKVNMLKEMDSCDPEYYKVKNWVDDFMQVPFGKYKGLDVNMTQGLDVCNKFMEDAMKILDDCAYGLTDAKMQILQLVGQWISNPDAMGTAIAIKGPMGTGKTTLVKDGISKILQRYFAFIPLGGCGDGSFLEGHSYTYEGSKHGKIVQVLKEGRCMNPVFYFDELDKVSESSRGEEITGILTHLTDTSQNNEFHDKFFADVDFDLSKALFIFSYNDESRVNPILRDRMYCIETKGYTSKEKVTIARDYLLPKIRVQVGFSKEEVIISDDIIEYIVGNKGLTKEEDGVRNLKRCLEVIHTKLNLFRLVKMNESENIFSKEIKMDVKFPFTVQKTDIDKLLKTDQSRNSVLSSMYI